jgi:hypothetical protein
MSENLEIDVFWSFRSPWSYLATPRLRQWQENYQLQVNFRPVYPIAIRTPEFFQQVQPQFFSYFGIDVFRVAEFLELPFAWANPDPIIQVPGENGRPQTAEDQPYIHRLTRLGVLAAEAGKGIEFADEISTLIWGGTPAWDQGDHLAQATARAGLDLAPSSSRTRQIMTRQAIGVCQPAHSRANPSLVRIAWMCCSGVCSRQVCRRADRG